jgi:hypothetical protein
MNRGARVSVLGLFGVVLAGCGGAGAGAGTVAGNDGGAVATDAFSCGIPCFFDVLSACPASGSCMTEARSMGVASCYANGVRESAERNPTSNSTTVTHTKADGTTCWSYEVPVGDGGVPSYPLEVTYKDGSGRAFGTVIWEGPPSDLQRAVTITCPGSPPEKLNPKCILDMLGATGLAPDGSQRCVAGRCR